MGRKKRIAKRAFYAMGGLSNGDLYRVQKRGAWQYYQVLG